jgi:hypothetical protein
MGILAGFIGGAARATGQIADQRIARYTAEEIQRQRDLMDQERERRIEEAQIAREGRAVAQRDKERTDTVARIDNESQNIAKKTVDSESGLIYSKQHLLEQTPEWQEQTDKALELKRQSIASNADTRFQAAINTGDISAKDAQVLLDSRMRIEAADRQQGLAAKNAEMRDATERYKADLKAKSDEAKDATANKRLEVMFSSISGGGSGGTKELMGILRETRGSLNDESKRLNDQMRSELEDAKYDPDAAARIKAQYKPKFDDLEKQQKRNAADLDFARTKFGLPKDEPDSSVQSGVAAPSPKMNGWDSDTGDVYAGGKKIGTAKTVDDARSLYSQAQNSSPQPEARKEVPSSKGLILPKQSLANVLSDGSSDKSVLDLNSKNAQRIQLATDEVKRASEVFAAASKSGDPKVISSYKDKLNEAKRNLDLLLKDMSPQKRDAVYQMTGM